MSTYGIIRRSTIRQFLPDELVEPLFLLAAVTIIVVGVGAHEAGDDEGHDDAWCMVARKRREGGGVVGVCSFFVLLLVKIRSKVR